ncbi:hypothetical protein EZV62_018627 [Acer yangbiense]|uniref:CCHC-type domain-containing protein n=1 Tax=Acer yangbiense TaxID=1000413 RepID=A0A5C7HK88_9ROSI|nr:hypothetical protein EZV62_018627 [Acer yangbiense]
MATEEIARLCKSLSIIDKNGFVVRISGEDKAESAKEVYHCLVGKVLSGKRVNREAFIGVLKQLWSNIGKVEIECVSDNIFMFYFNRKEDRDLVRIARSLAVKIGEVVDILADSKKCRGRFLQVKVCIDISQPLKMGLRLDVEDDGNFMVAPLIYEILPDFCFACGRIGHGLRVCVDDEARAEAL